jgi:pyruvate/2-oxoglutarate/acetoin dehydrogenase E1 component
MWRMGTILMTYKDELTKVMTDISKIDNLCFLGYNTAFGHRFNGTLNNVCESKCLEQPVAENLIMGNAMGLALEGFRPVACIERMDFLWTCADAIINHLDKARQLGWGNLDVIIRTCVGGTTPLNPGCQHCGDYVEVFKKLVSFPVLSIKRPEDVAYIWDIALKTIGPVMVVEHKNLYNERSINARIQV